MVDNTEFVLRKQLHVIFQSDRYYCERIEHWAIVSKRIELADIQRLKYYSKASNTLKILTFLTKMMYFCYQNTDKY